MIQEIVVSMGHYAMVNELKLKYKCRILGLIFINVYVNFNKILPIIWTVLIKFTF